MILPIFKPTTLAALVLAVSGTHANAEFTWNTGGGSLFDESNWSPAPPAGSIDPATPVSEPLTVASGSPSFSGDLHLGAHRLLISGGSMVGSSSGISADGNTTDIKAGLIMEGGTLNVDFLEDVVAGLSGDSTLTLQDANPLRDSFIEIASPNCSIRFVGMSIATARSLVNLRCSVYGLQAVENKNYRLVSSGGDTILEPYAYVWTGAGDGFSLYQGANWDTDPDTAGTQPTANWGSDKRLPASLVINSGNLGGGSGFGVNLNLYRYNIYMTGGSMKANQNGGITWGVNARNERNPMHVLGGRVEADWMNGVELHLSGTGRVILRDPDEALDNAVVVLSGTEASIEFTQAEYLQIVDFYLPMIDTDAGPADAGTNVCISPVSSGGWRLARIDDDDGDGMDDAWEVAWTGSTTATGTEDSDNDNLDLLGEFLAGTRPDEPDTDGDGLSDGAENSSDPLQVDSDGDGLEDGDETTTNPSLADTDGDGVKDGGEIRRGTDPLESSDRPEAPNVIVILVDDAGWGELGCYGNAKVKTPELDTMASLGVRFTDAYTNGCVCAPTRYSLMVGRHTGRAELRSWNVRMRAGDTSLATSMRDAGYQTGIFGKWAIGDAGNGGMPGQNGFDHFFGIVDHQEGHRHYNRYLWRNNERAFYNPFTAWEHGGSSLDVSGSGNHGTMSGNLETNRGNAHSHDLISDELFDWITNHKDDAFFACWNPIHPHGPLQESAHPDDLTDSDGLLADTGQRSMIDYHYSGSNLSDNQKIRAAQMSAIDYDVGRLIELLETLGIADNTVVFFTSDNGADQNWAVDADLQMTGGLRGWKFNLYEGGIRVPFLAWGKQVQAGQVSSVPVSLDDLMPTITELGTASPAPLASGRSICSLLDGSASELPTRPLYWEWSGGGKWSRAVRNGDWKLHRFRSTSTPVTVTHELYNLSSDPNETTDRSAEFPEVLAQLERIMDDPFYHDVGFENFRATDEFHSLTGDGSVAKGAIGTILDAGMTAWTPIAVDLETDASFEVRFKLDDGESGAFEVTDESASTFCGFTADRATSQLTFSSGAATVSAALPAAEPDQAWTAKLKWSPEGVCSISIGDVTLDLPAAASLSSVSQVRHRSLSGTAEFSSFRLFLGNLKTTSQITIEQEGVVLQQTRPNLPGTHWGYLRSDNLQPDSWVPAEILRESSLIHYGSTEQTEVVFPIQESGDLAPPLRRFYKAMN